MKELIKLEQVEQKLLTIRGQRVLLDSDVAALYEVQTKEVNQAVKNNPDKFPEGYIIPLSMDEWKLLRSKILTLSRNELVTNCDKFDGETEPVKDFDHPNLKSKILTSSWGGKNKLPNVFTEKGLYMLATILKGKRAAETTLAIVETYAKIRELTRTISQLPETTEKARQQTLMQKSGELMADILTDGMKTTGTETSIEVNLAILKLKHTIKRKPD